MKYLPVIIAFFCIAIFVDGNVEAAPIKPQKDPLHELIYNEYSDTYTTDNNLIMVSKDNTIMTEFGVMAIVTLKDESKQVFLVDTLHFYKNKYWIVYKQSI